VKSVDEPADFFVGWSSGASFRRTTRIRFQIAAGAEPIEQEHGETLKIGGGSGRGLLWFRKGLRIAREFVEADGYGLAKIHGAVLFAGRDAHEPMAVAEVFVREAALLRTEEKCDTAGREMLVQVTRSLIEAANRMLQLSRAYSGGSHHECAILDGFSDGLELFGVGKQRRRSDRRTRLAKGQFIRVHHAQMKEAEVAHSAGSGTDVEGITWGDKHNPQAVGFGIG